MHRNDPVVYSDNTALVMYRPKHVQGHVPLRQLLPKLLHGEVSVKVADTDDFDMSKWLRTCDKVRDKSATRSA